MSKYGKEHGQVINFICKMFESFEEPFYRSKEYILNGCNCVVDEIHLRLIMKDLIKTEMVQYEVIGSGDNQELVFAPTEISLTKYRTMNPEYNFNL